MYFAMGVEPTKLTACTSGCASSASTASLSPLTTLNTPSGRPASFRRPARISAAEGSRSEGFRTNVLPQTSAIGNIHSGTIAGKLNGVMPATTPSGWRSVYASMPALTFSVNSLFRSCGAPQAYSTMSMPRASSPAASDNTLPCSREIAATSSSARCSSSALKRNMTRARASGVVVAHAGNAAFAASTARPTSAAVANGTRAPSAPVAGV